MAFVEMAQPARLPQCPPPHALVAGVQLRITFDQREILPQDGVQKEGIRIVGAAMMKREQVISRQMPALLTKQVAQEIELIGDRKIPLFHQALDEGQGVIDEVGVGG
jgi:hypothetical protein